MYIELQVSFGDAFDSCNAVRCMKSRCSTTTPKRQSVRTTNTSTNNNKREIIQKHCDSLNHIFIMAFEPLTVFALKQLIHTDSIYKVSDQVTRCT